MSKIFKFFQTAPQTKSDKVIELEKRGQGGQIVKAVRNERKGQECGKSGSIIVKRVGTYSHSK